MPRNQAVLDVYVHPGLYVAGSEIKEGGTEKILNENKNVRSGITGVSVRLGIVIITNCVEVRSHSQLLCTDREIFNSRRNPISGNRKLTLIFSLS